MAFSAVLFYFLRWFQVLIDWGQSIYHWCPTHEKSVPGTEARGADRPEAYPTTGRRPIPGVMKNSERTFN